MNGASGRATITAAEFGDLCGRAARAAGGSASRYLHEVISLLRKRLLIPAGAVAPDSAPALMFEIWLCLRRHLRD